MRCILWWPAQQAPQGEGKGIIIRKREVREASVERERKEELSALANSFSPFPAQLREVGTNNKLRINKPVFCLKFASSQKFFREAPAFSYR